MRKHKKKYKNKRRKGKEKEWTFAKAQRSRTTTPSKAKTRSGTSDGQGRNGFSGRNQKVGDRKGAKRQANDREERHRENVGGKKGVTVQFMVWER